MLALSNPQLILFLEPVFSSSEGIGGMEACTTKLVWPADVLAITECLREVFLSGILSNQ